MTAMQCDRARERLGAYRDGELAPDERRAVAGHIETCRACSDALADDERIGRSVRDLGRTLAPPALVSRVRAALDRVEVDDRPMVQEAVGIRPPVRGLFKQAAALAAVCVISVVATWWVMDSAREAGEIEREVVNAHIRALLQESPVQVASSDQHTVRPWFAGRADFAPSVKDLAMEGFSLLGGRLDYVADRRVAVVVYKRHLHVIDVFMWPSLAAAESATQVASRNGYNLLVWSRNGVTYRAVSDLNSAEMRELQRLL